VVVSYPAAGSYNSTLYSVTYPVAEGGASVTVLSVAYPSQNCDVDVLNDGSGGTYTDWSTAINQAYKPFGEGITYDPTPQPWDFEVPSGSGNYYTGGTQGTNYNHDGYGSSYNEGVPLSYYSQDTDTNIAVLDVNQQTEVPSGSGTFFNNGKRTGYTWNGSGGYNYPVTKGNYYNSGVFITFVPDGTFSANTEVPTGSGTYYNAQQCGNDYFWNGSGADGMPVPVCNYYPNGTFIYNDGTSDWYWDGTGGFYT
jgi:hypothetical protein